MIRSAAGRAPADGPHRPGLPSAAVLVVLVCLGVLAPVLTAPAPAAAAPVGTLTAAPDDNTSDRTRPVRIDVSRFEPRTVAPGSTITISGTLTNTGDQMLTDLGVRLQRGGVMTTRAELLGADADADPATSAVPAFQDLPGQLPAGGSATFTYAVPSDDLQLTRDGVYPVLLNVNGTTGGGERRRVGQLATYVVQQPAIPAGQTAVAWLWPLVERTHRNASGVFADDGLADSVSSGGRLDRALQVVEGLPRTTPAGGGTPVPTVPVTLAVDPALVEELEMMAAGPYTVTDADGDGTAGRGTTAAQAFLQRLRVVAAVLPVVALPYGDVDADSLVAAGLGEVLTRSLPGSAEGTAEDAPAGDGTAATTTTTTSPSTGGAAGEQGAGARLLAAALGVTPRTDLAWLPDGPVRAATLEALRDGGASDVVLASGALTAGNAAGGLTAAPAAARTTVAVPSGALPALVADSELSAVAGSTDSVAGGERIAEQRYLAELALIGMRAPADPTQAPSVLVVPPREVSADVVGVRAMMSDTAELPWLRSATPAQLATGPVAAAGDLVAAADQPGLDGAGLTDVAAGLAVRDDLAGAVVDDPGTALAPYDAAVARTVSLAWRADPAGFRATAASLHRTLSHLRDDVTLLAPADGTYSLASSDAPLVLTVRNDLPFAVRVHLQVRTRGKVGLDISDVGLQELAPGERTTLQVPTHLRQSGRFAVTASLSTPSGGALGDRVDIQVKSTAYGTISLLITVGAAVLLGLLFLRRLVRFVLKRRRGAPPEDGGPGGPAPEGAAVPLPPTRSPV